MNYIKKMCILRQVKQGFSGDGKTLSGLIKIEQYGKNIAVEVSAINFAPLVSGEYYCLLADTHGKTELLPLRGKCIFNILSDIRIEQGFCGVICYVKNEVIPVAYGVNGDGVYDWKKLMNATLPTAYTPLYEEKTAASESVEETNDSPTNAYDDEKVCMENYYEKENDDEQELLYKTSGNARVEGAAEKQGEKEGLAAAQDDDADGVLHPFKTDGDGYYQSVKHEIDKLLAKYPRDTRLCGAFSCSEWVRIENDGSAEEYLVGVVYANGAAKYVCYALPAKEKDNPPKEIADVCVFVPQSPFRDTEGFFVIFQSAATGECIKPKKI